MVNTYPLMEIFPGELSSEKTEWLLLRGIKKESLFYFPLGTRLQYGNTFLFAILWRIFTTRHLTVHQGKKCADESGRSLIEERN